MAAPRTKIQINKVTATLLVPNSKGKTAVTLNADLMDHTFTNLITADQIAALGDEKKSVLDALSASSQADDMGGKNVLWVPSSEANNITGYEPVSENKDTRLRQATRAEIVAGTETILRQHPNLLSQLDSQLTVNTGTEKLNYDELHRFMEENAGFIETHMAELQGEGSTGKFARFNQANVTTLSLTNNRAQKLAGVIRIISVGDKIVYLADETVFTSILPTEPFSTATQEEAHKERFKFFFAYLMNQVCKILPEQAHLTIIAAAPRVSLYETAGFKRFESNSFGDYTALMRFVYPTKGNRLFQGKETLQQNAAKELAERAKAQAIQSEKDATLPLAGQPGVSIFGMERKATESSSSIVASARAKQFTMAINQTPH